MPIIVVLTKTEVRLWLMNLSIVQNLCSLNSKNFGGSDAEWLIVLNGLFRFHGQSPDSTRPVLECLLVDKWVVVVNNKWCGQLSYWGQGVITMTIPKHRPVSRRPPVTVPTLHKYHLQGPGRHCPAGHHRDSVQILGSATSNIFRFVAYALNERFILSWQIFLGEYWF